MHIQRSHLTRGPSHRRLFAALASVALLFGACGAPAETQTSSPAQTADPQASPSGELPSGELPSGELVIGLADNWSTLDPHGHSERAVLYIEFALFDKLIEMDRDGNLVPGLAESWESIDELTWELRLRKGVQFHNGEPMNAEAVKFSLERISEPDRASPLGYFITPITEIDIVDDYTVRLHTDEPLAVLPNNITTRGHVLPPRYIQEVGDDGFVNHPIGTGPYKFVRSTPGEEVVVEANLDYWRGVPSIERVVYRAIPEPSTRLNELRTGGIDINVSLLADQLPLVAGDPNLKAASSEVLRVYYILIEPEGPLADVRVRQAMNHALNVDQYIEDIYSGAAFRVPAFTNPQVFGFHPDLEGYAYDPDRARQLLAEAGYPQGFSTTLHGGAAGVRQPEDLTQAIVSDLRAVGVDVELDFTTDSAALEGLFRSGEAGPMILTSWGYSNVFDAEGLYTGNFKCGAPRTLWCDEELDRLIDLQLTQFTPDERLKTLHTIQERLHEEAAGISLLGAKVNVAFRSRVNWEPTGDELVNVFRDVTLSD